MNPGDVIDAALDSTQDEISSQLAEVESRELASIENALQQMQIGRYGVCEICNSKIPMARLNALPYATMCIACQRDVERMGLGSAQFLKDSEDSDNQTVSGEMELDLS